MPREIKFRAWDTEKKEMFTPDFIDGGDGHILEYIEYASPSLRHSAILMQYTGLKDRNGKEIYEGDLVKNNGYIWEVTWKDGAVYIENKTGKGVWWIGGESKYCEVIGSVYENPELFPNKIST